MAALKPQYQTFLDTKQGFQIGVTQAKIETSSDTITVPSLANTTNSASSAQVRDSNEDSVTVTDDGANTVTLASGTVGGVVTIITIHRNINYGAEA